MEYKKPQATIIQGNVGIYPLTTADQVILADGTRLEKDGKINVDVANSANSAKLGGKAPEYYIQPRNLLDNSDFTNLVNQRGIKSETSVSAYSYFIDRWVNQTSEARSFTLSTSGIGLPLTTTLLQKIEKIEAGKIVTIAIKLSDGTIATLTGTVQYTGDGAWMRFASITHSFGDMYMETMNGVMNVVVYNTKVITIEWAALYEGSYTADTLPPYVPKGYGAELAECQRYFYKMMSYWKWISAGICESSTKAYIPIVLPREMRIVPTVSITDPSLIKVKCGSIGLQIPSDIKWLYGILDARIMEMEATVTGATGGNVAFLYFDRGGEINFSSDL